MLRASRNSREFGPRSHASDSKTTSGPPSIAGARPKRPSRVLGLTSERLARDLPQASRLADMGDSRGFSHSRTATGDDSNRRGRFRTEAY
jgi:hypothetical protein